MDSPSTPNLVPSTGFLNFKAMQSTNKQTWAQTPGEHSGRSSDMLWSLGSNRGNVMMLAPLVVLLCTSSVKFLGESGCTSGTKYYFKRRKEI